jgi:Domain of unknown function (DUF3362)
MYYTGIDPFTKEEVYIAKQLRDRKMQRALLQFFKPENYFEVRQALIEAERQDLICGCEGLIPANAPAEALKARRERANQEARGEYVHTIPSGQGETRGKAHGKNRGYRPDRQTEKRRGQRFRDARKGD